MAFPPFAVTVDLVVFTIRDDALQVLTIRRGEAPYKGRPALPGGFVGVDEDLTTAAARELAEETGIGTVDRLHLEQLGTYGAPKRDSRMRTVSVSYLAFAADLANPIAGTDAAAATWMPVTDAIDTKLAFDHSQILHDGLERARAKLEYTTLAARFCTSTFTIADLRDVYEQVWDTELDPANFHRKVMATKGFLSDTGETISRGRGRPARLYRAGNATMLSPPLTR